MKHAVAIVCLCFAACSAGPRPQIPTAATVEIADAWRGETHSGEIDTDWWGAFGDPTLSQIVEMALAHNSDVAVAASRVEEARAQLQLASAQSWPSINLIAAGGRGRDLNAFGQAVTQTLGKAQFAIAYDADLFGRLSNATNAARAALLATQAAHDNVRLAIVATTVTAYINLRAADARLILLTNTFNARAEALRLAKRRAGAGYAGDLEAQQAQAEYQAAAQLIPIARLAIRRQEDALSVLLNQSPNVIQRGASLMDITAPTVPGGLPSELLKRRPDILQAEQTLVAADHSLDSSRAAYMPSLQLSLSGGYVNSSLIDGPVGIFNLGGSLLAPIFSAGRLKAQADIAASRRDQAAFIYQKTVVNAFREVEDGLAANVELIANEAAVKAQRDAFVNELDLVSERVTAGYSPYLEQLDAQRGLFAADVALLQARADRLFATINLYQALGGGWSSPAKND